MALSYDSAHKPAAATSSATSTSTVTATSAAFSPQAGQIVIFKIAVNEATISTMTAATPTNTGTALTWALINSEHYTTSPYGGCVYAWWAYNANTQASITVSSVITWSSGPTAGEYMAAIDLWDGANTASPIGTKPAPSYSASPFAVSVTPAQAGSALCILALDWSAAGAFSASSSGTWVTDSYYLSGAFGCAAGMYGTSATAPTLTPDTTPVTVQLAQGSGSPAIQGFAWEVKGTGGTNATVPMSGALAGLAAVPAAQVMNLSGPNYATTAADLGGGAGSWANTGNAGGAPDSTYAAWTVV